MPCNLRVHPQEVYLEVIGHCIFKGKVWQEILVCVCIRNVMYVFWEIWLTIREAVKIVLADFVR